MSEGSAGSSPLKVSGLAHSSGEGVDASRLAVICKENVSFVGNADEESISELRYDNEKGSAN